MVRRANTGLGDDGVYYKTSISTLFTTDLILDVKLSPNLNFAIGANNALDRRPGTYNPAQLASYRNYPTGLNSHGQQEYGDPTAVLVPPEFAPFGFNGGYYFAKLTAHF